MTERNTEPIWREWSPMLVEQVMSSLEALSDRSYQERKWLRGEGEEISTFTEEVCGLFDDTGLDEAWRRGRIVFAADLDHELQALGKLLDRFAQHGSDAEILLDPAWNEALRLAARCLDCVRRITSMRRIPDGVETGRPAD